MALASPYSANALTDYEASYLDNSGYEASGSVVQCQAFIRACRALMLRRPTKAMRSAGDGHFALDWNVEAIRGELNRALQWLSFSPAAQPDSGVVFPSFEESRDYDSGYSGGAARSEPYGDQQR